VVRPDVVAGAVEEVTAVAAALRDADSAVRERQLLIQRERDALQTADRAKDEFIAALSHELRNPLAALTSASHILRTSEPANPLATDARGVIDRQTKHMSRMIEDLLDVSRIIMGTANLVFERLDLAQLVANTVDAWRTGGRFALCRWWWVRSATASRRGGCRQASRTSAGWSRRTSRARASPCASRARRLRVVLGCRRGAGLSPDLMAHAFDVFSPGRAGCRAREGWHRRRPHAGEAARRTAGRARPSRATDSAKARHSRSGCPPSTAANRRRKRRSSSRSARLPDACCSSRTTPTRAKCCGRCSQ
jgi:hypothetical protein